MAAVLSCSEKPNSLILTIPVITIAAIVCSLVFE